ncbi:MAG: hypothetical protein IPM17_07025 [Verrucomicrobia bacterium]|nr:hypothetical protein [Verrucomicrobiota bacterium]
MTGDTPAASAAPLSPRGEHSFTPPGNNAAGDADWLLVLNAKGK